MHLFIIRLGVQRSPSNWPLCLQSWACQLCRGTTAPSPRLRYTRAVGQLARQLAGQEMQCWCSHHTHGSTASLVATHLANCCQKGVLFHRCVLTNAVRNTFPSSDTPAVVVLKISAAEFAVTCHLIHEPHNVRRQVNQRTMHAQGAHMAGLVTNDCYNQYFLCPILNVIYEFGSSILQHECSIFNRISSKVVLMCLEFPIKESSQSVKNYVFGATLW